MLTLSARVGWHIERAGLLVRALDTTYLALEPHDDGGLAQVLGSSVTDRIAMGPRPEYEAFTLHGLTANTKTAPGRERPLFMVTPPNATRRPLMRGLQT